MSLGVVFKGPEGIVIAADSRVTLTPSTKDPNDPSRTIVMPATYDHATKLLQFNLQKNLGAVTYGLGALMTKQGPRTAHSFVPEFEESLANNPELGVEEFATRLGNFYMDRHSESGAGAKGAPDMTFLVAGYDSGEAYGRVFEVNVPSQPKPKEWQPDGFGAVWGGQTEVPDRLLNGMDRTLVPLLKDHLGLSDQQTRDLAAFLGPRMVSPVPYQFLPLQDCVDLAALIMRATIDLQRCVLGTRGVGGPVDIATITRTEGFRAVQRKTIQGEKWHGRTRDERH